MTAPEPEDDQASDNTTSDDTTSDDTSRRDLDDASVDAAFADIVAMWRADPGPDDAGTAVGPAQPSAEPDTSKPDSESLDEIREIFAARRRRIEREIDQNVDGPDGGHFVPPDPAPLPQLDVFTVLAWVGALLGPVFIVIGAFTGGLIPRWIIGAAVAATIGGFVLLVSRLPRRDEADPDDNGAVV